MQRRDFLKFISASAAAAGIASVPAAKALASAPDQGGFCVRFLQVYDVHNAQVLCRLDMSQAELHLPSSIDSAIMYSNVPVGRLLDMCDRIREKVPSMPARQVMRQAFARLPGTGEIYGIQWRA